jgi:hypothetical protein
MRFMVCVLCDGNTQNTFKCLADNGTYDDVACDAGYAPNTEILHDEFSSSFFDLEFGHNDG